MTTDVDALITRLREDVGFDGQKLLAADALSSQAERIKQQALDYVSLFDQCSEQAERIQALEAKCALLAASLAQEEKRSAELERDAARYRWLRARSRLLAAEERDFVIKCASVKKMGGMDAVIDEQIAAQAGSKEGT